MSKFISPVVVQWLSALSGVSLVFVLMTYGTYSSAETPSAKANDIAVDGYETQVVPFITLRNKTGSVDPSDYYGGERSTVSAGYCEFSSMSLSSLKAITEKVPFYIPEDIVKLRAISESGIDDLWRDMKNSSNGQHLTLYTHGFNIDFEKGCKRASLFQKSVDLHGRFVFFSWPSDGALMNYTHDEADLYWSVEPLRQMLSDMVVHFGAGDINVVAHSLGTRGVLLALVMMAQAEHGDKPVLNEVVLIAPDIDAGVFKQYLPMIKPLAKNITIYVSANDSPLVLSRQVHGYPRLGEPGPHLDGLAGIEIIDISDNPIRSPTGHLYHLYHSVVSTDLDQLVNDGKSASQRGNLKQKGENYWLLQPLLNDKDTAEN